MDNEKVQDVSGEAKNETPEEVQNETELRSEDQPQKAVIETVSDKVDDKAEAIPSQETSQPPSSTNSVEEVLDESFTEEDEVNGKTPDEVQETADESPAENSVKSDQEEAQSDDSNQVQEEVVASEAIVEEEKISEEEAIHEEEEVLDFDNASKEELIKKTREVKNEENIRRLDQVLKAVKPRFDDLFELAKNEALQRFVSDGNEADAFEYHGDEIDKEFITLYGQLKSKRNKHYRDLETEKESNLKKKETLLENLRQIVDGEESANSINAVRDLQSDWKKIGSVPSAYNKTLWANYNALLDRYYDNRSIYFELKDLDRKKNLSLKEELCQKAEDLGKSEDLKTAIIQLNDLHEEYKHIGPVPKDNQEPLWQRFKAASDAIYAQRKEYFEGLKGQFEENLVQKEALITKLAEFTAFTSDRITDWNAKTKEILDVQKQWDAIGGVPKEKAKATNKAFWHSFKGFFANKNQFFKVLEGKREENLMKKQEIIEKAEALQESDDWNSTADKLKHLQGVWRDIGPVPEKVKNETYAKFKAACDHFFNRKREQNQEQFKAYEENLKLKMQICDQLENASQASDVDLDQVYDLIDNFTIIGFVPKNAIKKSRNRFDAVKEKLLANEAIEEGDRQDLRAHFEMGRLRNTPGGEHKLQRKEHSIRRKITGLENDISTWNTNMEFFANSATADKLKADMKKKIENAEAELVALKNQLKSIQ